MSIQESRWGAGTVLDGRYQLASEGIAIDVGLLFKAYEVEGERPVDVMVLALRAEDQAKPLADLEQAQEALKGLGTPSLIPYEHIGLVEGQPYLVRGHLEAESLAGMLSREGFLDTRTAVDIAIGVCEALAPAHRAGLVHGSLSPYSIWLAEGTTADQGPGPAVLLTDAGLLPALRPLQSAPGKPWGRIPYLTPEQMEGEVVQPASDVYVIGSLFYTMLAGRPPFRSQEGGVLVLQHLRQEPPSLHVLAPDVPPPLTEIVEKALAKEPAARYRNAGQLAQILRTQLRMPPPVRPSPIPAIITQSASTDRRVVPAPPRTQRPAVRPVARNYEFIEDEDWTEPREGPDWILILLFVAAIAAVLGLVPLWRAVYERYSAPPSLPTPAVQRWSAPRGAVGPVSCMPGWETELDHGAVLWYNKESSQSSPGTRVIGLPAGGRQLVAGVLVLQLWTRDSFWESSLRVAGKTCDKLTMQSVFGGIG